MPPQVRFGDVISNAGNRAMFVAWGEPWRVELMPVRPTQHVVILAVSRISPILPVGRVVRVNWLSREGDRFVEPVERS